VLFVLISINFLGQFVKFLAKIVTYRFRGSWGYQFLGKVIMLLPC